MLLFNTRDSRTHSCSSLLLQPILSRFIPEFVMLLGHKPLSQRLSFIIWCHSLLLLLYSFIFAVLLLLLDMASCVFYANYMLNCYYTLDVISSDAMMQHEYRESSRHSAYNSCTLSLLLLLLSLLFLHVMLASSREVSRELIKCNNKERIQIIILAVIFSIIYIPEVDSLSLPLVLSSLESLT